MAEDDEIVLRGGLRAGASLELAVREDVDGRGDADLQLRAAKRTLLEKRLGILRRVSEILGRLERKMAHRAHDKTDK